MIGAHLAGKGQSQVLDCLKKLGGRATPSDIAAKIKTDNGMSSLNDTSNVGRALRELYDAGHIEGIEKEGRNRYYVLKKEEEIPDIFNDGEPLEAAQKCDLQRGMEFGYIITKAS